MDGQVVAVGGWRNDRNGSNSGHIRIFRFSFEKNKWENIGDNIDGEASDDYFGWSVALSVDKLTVAAGRPGNDENELYDLYDFWCGKYGHIRIFRFSFEKNKWEQVGDDINGEASGDEFGQSVVLLADGQVVASGGNGHIRIFLLSFDKNKWEKIGKDIDSEVSHDYFGTSVALLADGQVVAADGINNDVNGSYSGHMRIYRLSCTSDNECDDKSS